MQSWQLCVSIMWSSITKLKLKKEVNSSKTILKEILSKVYYNRLLPRSKDKDIIIVIVDWFTKIIRLKTTTVAVLLGKIARIYRDNMLQLKA